MHDTLSPRVKAMIFQPPERTAVESLRGHFFALDLYTICRDGDVPALTGDALQFGADRIELDLEHTRQLADRVRAAIDNCIAGAVIHRPTCSHGGH